MFCKHRIRRLQATVICCQCLLLTMMQGLGKLDETPYPLHFGLFSERSPRVHAMEGAVVVIRLCCALGWGCQPNAAEMPTSCHKVHDTRLPLGWISWRNLVLLLDTQLILLGLEGNSPESETTVSSLGVQIDQAAGNPLVLHWRVCSSLGKP